jgi:hypothetical protein
MKLGSDWRPRYSWNMTAEALDIVLRYYPAGQVQPKTQYFVESVFEELQQ